MSAPGSRSSSDRAARNFFLFPTAILLIAGAVVVLPNGKSELHLAQNAVHTPALDTFFLYVTVLGSGQWAAIVACLLLLVRFRYALSVGLSCIVTGIIVQLLKRLVFTQAVRPRLYFEGTDALRTVPGVDLHSFGSLPSGHAATAFCLYFMLALIIGRRAWSLALFVIATLAAYSRVYLSQHFLVDVLVGATVGVGIAWLTRRWLERRLPPEAISLGRPASRV